MSDDPRDQPTRVVRQPAVPAAAPPPVAGPVGVDPDWAIRADDRLKTLQGFVTLLAIVALAALGLAIWALTQEDDSNRVDELAEQVDELRSQPPPQDGAATTP